MRKPHDSTVEVLLDFYDILGTWRNVAEHLGYPESYIATLSDVARGSPGSISEHGERLLRDRMGVLEVVWPVDVMPCPTCGKVHHLEDCNGTNGDLVIRPRPKSPPRTRSYTPRPVTTKEQERRRAALGAQWRDVIDAGLAALESTQPTESED